MPFTLDPKHALFYVEFTGTLDLIKRLNRRLVIADFQTFELIYLHPHVCTKPALVTAGYALQPKATPEIANHQRNLLAKDISRTAVKFRQKTPDLLPHAFGIYLAQDEVEALYTHEHTIDEITDAGGFLTFQTEQDGMVDLSDGFNRELIKTVWRDRLC